MSIEQREDKTFEVTHSLVGNILLDWLYNRQVDNSRYRRGQWSNSTDYQTINRHIEAFMKDPYGVVTTTLNMDFDHLLDPPDLSDMDYKKDRSYSSIDFDDERKFSESSGNALFFKEGVIQEIFQSESNWETVENFFDALKFVGFELKASWSLGSRGYDDRKLSGLMIDIPERDGQAGHTISINAQSPHVDIECGYQADEDRWMDRQQRQAVEQMADLEELLKPEKYDYEIEL
jgi:hypothetical protein